MFFDRLCLWSGSVVQTWGVVSVRVLLCSSSWFCYTIVWEVFIKLSYLALIFSYEMDGDSRRTLGVKKLFLYLSLKVHCVSFLGIEPKKTWHTIICCVRIGTKFQYTPAKQHLCMSSRFFSKSPMSISVFFIEESPLLECRPLKSLEF